MRPPTTAWTAAGDRLTSPRTTSPASTSGRWGTPRPRGVTRTSGVARPPVVPVEISSSVTPGQGAVKAPVAATAGVATGHDAMGSTAWDRCRRNPTVPPAPTARRTRDRHPSPWWSPGTASTATVVSIPASRESCSAIRGGL